jgi:hypothetical protein
MSNLSEDFQKAKNPLVKALSKGGDIGLTLIVGLGTLPLYAPGEYINTVKIVKEAIKQSLKPK